MKRLLLTLALVTTALPSVAQAPAQGWRTIATAEDRRRMRDWRDAWVAGLTGARTDGHQAEIAAEGVLLDPDIGLIRPAPAPGDYDCRVIKLGSQSASLTWVTYPPFHCRIELEDGVLAFTKLTGSQRPIGRLYPDTDMRMIFLGTMQLGDERRAYQYGIDRDRDMIGMVQRIGPARWRLVLPHPRFESLLDVIELTPRAR